jgi:cytochrome P450
VCLLLQVNSVVVAGHDTTSFCLTSTLYWVSQNPDAKQQLFAELDRFGRDRKVTADNMDQLPYLGVGVLCAT